jgi:Tol biopolymer transport system component
MVLGGGLVALGLLLGGGSDPAPAPAAAVSFRQLTILPGAELDPAISPDGESLLFVKDVGGQTDVFLQRVGGRNPINLTSGCAENDGEPAFSPDGRKIAYRSDCSGGGIFVMGATGESARKLSDFGHSPAWSPDGAEIAVGAQAPGSPWGRGALSEAWAIRADSGERRLLSRQDAMHPAWSPDGRRVAFWGIRAPTSQRDLWTVSADGSQSEPGEAIDLTEDAALDWKPVWAPDGASVFFGSSRGGTFNLWRLPVDPGSGRPLGDPVPVTAPSSFAGWPSLSGDGRRLVFVDRNARTALFLARIAPEGTALVGAPQPISLGSFEIDPMADVAPGGMSVVVATAGLPQNLYLTGPGGAELRQLTEGAQRDRQARWSPDGGWIAFQTDRFPSDLALIRPDGSGLRAIETGHDSAWYPVWAPDGKRLAFTSYAGVKVVEITLEGPGGAVTALPQPPSGGQFWPWSWSPDGRTLAGDVFVDGNSIGPALHDLRAGTYRQLVRAETGVAYSPTFLPSGRAVVWTRGTDIVVHDLAADASRTWVRASPGSKLLFPQVSADGLWLVYVEASDESDVWLANLGAD